MAFYRFVNVTKNVDDYSGKTNIQNVGMLSLFESVISTNGWNEQDVIMAFPEIKENPILRYAGGDIEMKIECDECVDDNHCYCQEIADDASDISVASTVKSNCNICGDHLENHDYGNVCVKHIPSYALWEGGIAPLRRVDEEIDMDGYLTQEEYDSDRDAFYEELSERKLVNELDDDRYDEYECECIEESFY